MIRKGVIGVACLIGIATWTAAATAGELEVLAPGQRLADFRVEAVYENADGRLIGARLRHLPSAFVLDVLRIQSVPQAMVWVNTPPPSDQGEPHTLEHLLLGKGTKGRAVASLEDMWLARSSAFTQQLRTCFHFSTVAGPEVFFRLFEAKLDALLHPDYSDEEIRREVCNLGVVTDAAGGALALEEKGTVYNEMVSSYERPWTNVFDAIEQEIYGPQHPAALSSGGRPAAIRTMTPADLRRFHSTTYHLANMGAVVSIGDAVGLAACLERLSAIFRRLEPAATAGDDPALLWSRLPAPAAAPPGRIERVHFPHQNASEPGQLLFAWPARAPLDSRDTYLLELFIDLLAGGSTSNLYARCIDSQTRVLDLGATSVFGQVAERPGQPVLIGFASLDPERCDAASVARVRALIQDEIRAIAALGDGSVELAAFAERARNRVREDRRGVRKFLNSPPRFGYRGTGARWVDHLQRQRRAGFRRNLALAAELGAADSLLAGDHNFWRPAIERWGLLATPPYATAATADPGLIAAGEAARRARIAAAVAGLRRTYGTATDAEAIARYRQDYDRRSAVIEAAGAALPAPRFLDDPPLGLDDGLETTVLELPGGGPLVAADFEVMTGATIGLALRLDVVPESLLVYVPALPIVLTEIGVVRDGQPLAYDAFAEALRREILELRAYPAVNDRTERVELTLRGAGTDLDESRKALGWMQTALFAPDLRSENLPRIRDAVDLALGTARNRMGRAEETWVWEPANAYWKQRNPLILHAGCFLTQIHDLHRLRWQLREAEGGAAGEFGAVMAALAAAADELDRDGLRAALEAVLARTAGEAVDAPPAAAAAQPDWVPLVAGLSPPARGLVHEAVEDLRLALGDLPEATLAADLHYLCAQMSADLELPPRSALAALERLLELVRHRDNVRAFLVSNAAERAALQPALTAIIERLDPGRSQRQTYARRPRVTARLAERLPGAGQTLYVALVNPSTRSGVHVHTADCASYRDTDRERLLDFLAARLYGGGGAHSMFMKTWGAGLAYSNGLRSDERRGRLIYYAERCPDLAQTMQFVVGELRRAQPDTALAEYAVAQAFAGSRAGSRYEERGEAAAADLADGVPPQVVHRFRRAILELRGEDGFAGELAARMEATYGRVLPGYGPGGAAAAARFDAVYFVIGPETQLQSWERYLRGVEPDAVLDRLYPRDFWLVQPPPDGGNAAAPAGRR